MTALVARLGGQRVRLLAGVLALAGMAALYAGTARHVTILVDGDVRAITTHARDVRGVLHDAGIMLSPQDRIEPALNSPIQDRQTIELTTARKVAIDGPDGQSVLVTAEDSPADILAAAGLRIFPGDRLWSDGIPVDQTSSIPAARPDRVRLITAKDVHVIADGQDRMLRTAAATVGQALWEGGFIVFEGDRVKPAMERSLEGVTSISLTRSRPLSVTTDGSTIQTRAIGDTVGQALADAGVSLIGLDYTRPPLDSEVPPDGNIRVVRVEERVDVEEKPIPFETTYQPIDDLEIDNQKVIDNGAYGVLANRVRIRLEDGEETRRFVESDWVAREPESRVIGYGTQVIPRSMNTDDGPIQYCRAITMYATAYSPSRAGVPPDAKNYGITASGKPLTRGLVAIDRSLIPFGTLMYVPGYGFAEAADTGGGVKGRWIDLGYDDDNYVAWHQYVTVYFLCPLPGMAWIFP
jgi:uncharacterized protein YabE (DUF348 family)